MLLDLLAWGDPQSLIRVEHDGSCYVMTYENELSPTDNPVFQEIVIDDHKVTVYFGNGRLPDMFIVEAPPGFQVSEPLVIEEGDQGVILSCPLLLG